MEKIQDKNGWGEYGRQKIKEHLFFTLVNRERNEKMLSDMPHVKFLDLAIVFNYLLAANDGRIQSFKINNRIMEAWGLDTQGIYDMARNNMERLMPEMAARVSAVVSDLAKGGDLPAFPDEESEDMRMYVITNKYAVNGSATILYSKKLESLASEMRCDMYVLPSSIHEMIIVPKTYYDNADSLKKLVKEVNGDIVDPEEQLSDNVYCYDWQNGNIYIC